MKKISVKEQIDQILQEASIEPCQTESEIATLKQTVATLRPHVVLKSSRR